MDTPSVASTRGHKSQLQTGIPELHQYGHLFNTQAPQQNHLSETQQSQQSPFSRSTHAQLCARAVDTEREREMECDAPTNVPLAKIGRTRCFFQQAVHRQCPDVLSHERWTGKREGKRAHAQAYLCTCCGTVSGVTKLPAPPELVSPALASSGGGTPSSRSAPLPPQFTAAIPPQRSVPVSFVDILRNISRAVLLTVEISASPCVS